MQQPLDILTLRVSFQIVIRDVRSSDVNWDCSARTTDSTVCPLPSLHQLGLSTSRSELMSQDFHPGFIALDPDNFSRQNQLHLHAAIEQDGPLNRKFDYQPASQWSIRRETQARSTHVYDAPDARWLRIPPGQDGVLELEAKRIPGRGTPFVTTTSPALIFHELSLG
jgi:hypothetical protein